MKTQRSLSLFEVALASALMSLLLGVSLGSIGDTGRALGAQSLKMQSSLTSSAATQPIIQELREARFDYVSTFGLDAAELPDGDAILIPSARGGAPGQGFSNDGLDASYDSVIIYAPLLTEIDADGRSIFELRRYVVAVDPGAFPVTISAVDTVTSPSQAASATMQLSSGAVVSRSAGQLILSRVASFEIFEPEGDKFSNSGEPNGLIGVIVELVSSALTRRQSLKLFARPLH
jgi:hypothetical protein